MAVVHPAVAVVVAGVAGEEEEEEEEEEPWPMNAPESVARRRRSTAKAPLAWAASPWAPNFQVLVSRGDLLP